MKILLLGANGQVGNEFQRQWLASRSSDVTGDNGSELICATRTGKLVDGKSCEFADLSDTKQLDELIQTTRPDWIVNAAAYTAVDKAESDFEMAWAINAQALKVIAAAANKVDASVLHFSTDYVFDGNARSPYSIHDATAPVNRYGESKLGGELFLRESGVHHIILRTQWVYAARGHNFLRTMLRLGLERDELRIVNDQRGAPTSARMIASVTAQLLMHAKARSMRAIHHLVCSGETTWFEFAEAIFESALDHHLISRKPNLLPITSDEFPTPAKRPRYSVLDTSKLMATFEIELPNWRDELINVVQEISRNQTDEQEKKETA